MIFDKCSKSIFKLRSEIKINTEIIFVKDCYFYRLENQIMQLVTFTSDFGQDDYYEAALKGAMFSKVANLQIVDVSNNVEPYDIITAAFLVKNAYPNFPKGTIHIVSVDNYYDAKSEFILLGAIKY